jgi:hypothetical protein
MFRIRYRLQWFVPIFLSTLVGKADWEWGLSVLALLGFGIAPVTVGLTYTGGRLRGLKSYRKLIFD